MPAIVGANATFNVKYNANANNVSGMPLDQTASWIIADYTEKSMTLSGKTPSRTYFSFSGWAFSASGNVAKQPGDKVYHAFNGLEDETYNCNLYAVWAHNTAYVNFDANGGSGAPSRVSHWAGYSVTLPTTTPTRSGYNFLGWSKNADATTATYLPGETYALYTTVTLYAVWEIAASTVTTPASGTLGSALAISISRNNSSYKHKLEYQYGSATGTIAQKVDTSYSWTPPLSLAAQFPSATSGTCKITCKTFNGSTLIGTKTTTLTLNIPDTVKCGISAVTLTENVAGIASKFGGFVQGHSKIKVNVTADTSNAQGATVSSISVRINGQTLSGNNQVTDFISNHGTLSFSAAIVDSRGRTAEYNGTYNVYEYTTPTITHKVKRAAAMPSSIVVEYTHGISPCGNHNDKKIEIHYKKTTDAYYTEEPTITPSAYSATSTYTITDTDPNATYLVKTIVSDAFNEVSVENKVAATGDRLLHFSASKKTISLHNTNPNDGKDHEFKVMVFHEGIMIGSKMLTESQLTALLTLI